MNSDIEAIHHVGHVVRDMNTARDLYRKLGFLCSAPAYPTLSREAGEPAKPFGAVNMHAPFVRNFVEVMALATEESHLPDDAQPIPLQVPPGALAGVVASIERTIATIAASLDRFEGLHILVLQTADANETARRFDQIGVGHSGVNRVQQPHQLVPMGVCTPDAQIEAYVERYQRYLGSGARRDGAAHVFDLKQSCVRLIPASRLGDLLPGETAPVLPAFVAYAVAVRDPGRARRWLEDNGFPVNAEASGGIFVPSKATLGAAVIFRQASEQTDKHK
jgi:catechol 2,3-dioxygenase-like lactoylglutathione lyase family enzyme